MEMCSRKEADKKRLKKKRWYDRRIKVIWGSLDFHEDRESCPMCDMSLNSVSYLRADDSLQITIPQ